MLQGSQDGQKNGTALKASNVKVAIDGSMVISAGEGAVAVEATGNFEVDSLKILTLSTIDQTAITCAKFMVKDAVSVNVSGISATEVEIETSGVVEIMGVNEDAIRAQSVTLNGSATYYIQGADGAEGFNGAQGFDAIETDSLTLNGTITVYAKGGKGGQGYYDGKGGDGGHALNLSASEIFFEEEVLVTLYLQGGNGGDATQGAVGAGGFAVSVGGENMQIPLDCVTQVNGEPGNSNA